MLVSRSFSGSPDLFSCYASFLTKSLGRPTADFNWPARDPVLVIRCLKWPS